MFIDKHLNGFEFIIDLFNFPFNLKFNVFVLLGFAFSLIIFFTAILMIKDDQVDDEVFSFRIITFQYD